MDPVEKLSSNLHTEEIQEIISTPPGWLLHSGTTAFLVVLVLIIGMSGIINYPDVIRTQLLITSLNAPKPIQVKISGKLTKLLVTENQEVPDGQPLAYLESTANHAAVLKLLADCKNIVNRLYINQSLDPTWITPPANLQLGEVQEAYQSFYQIYLDYKSSISDGFLVKKRSYLESELINIEKQKQQWILQKNLSSQDTGIAQEEYNVHQQLHEQGVETPMELRLQKSKLLGRKAPIIQAELNLITLTENHSERQNEIAELDNQIANKKANFIQALNRLISDLELWKSKYVLIASQAGKVSFVGIIQENAIFFANQNIFYINSGNEHFFGEINVPQSNMGKIKVGQTVLLKLRSYPFEEYGIISGKLISISDIPLKDTAFAAQVSFSIEKPVNEQRKITIKYGMIADAEIIVEKATILQRLYKNLIHMAR